MPVSLLITVATIVTFLCITGPDSFFRKNRGH
jgi:hypothetical protein